MIFAAVVGALCALALSLLARPLLTRGRQEPLEVSGSTAYPARRVEARLGDTGRSLLRQLRDLDDDAARGMLSEPDLRRLRTDLERRVADALRSGWPEDGAAGSDGTETAATTGGGSSKRRGSRRRAGAAVALLVALPVGVAARQLPRALDERPAAPSASVERPGGGSPEAAAPDVPGRPSAEAVAAVETAVAEVRRSPGSPAAHVALARAYTRAGQAQLATVEYLATTRLDPGNPEANTALALIAFKTGTAEEAERMVDRALRERPGYPEALYTRGLIRAMGLDDPAAAKRDFEAYLEAAPFGAHRVSVQTLLALLDGGAR